MSCSFGKICGGCCFRDMSLTDYREQKTDRVRNILQLITRQNFRFETPIFIDDGNRRRAALAFAVKKGRVILGFNASASSEIIDINNCELLTPAINAHLGLIRQLLSELTKVNWSVKVRKKGFENRRLEKGDVLITEADNGLDVVLEIPYEPNLEMRQIIFELISGCDGIIRVSHRLKAESVTETIMEKIRPYIKIAGQEVLIPAGTFLQPSKAGEQALINRVNDYLGETVGKIADLFCGAGTFSYSLAGREGCSVIAADSSPELLAGFQDSLNRQMISNIKIINRNLFKYPLSGKELHGLSAVVFDPPRAGAKEQVKALADLPTDEKPAKIVAVSCNPHSFVRDANILIEGGYSLEAVTAVDQFIYSQHCELVALFCKD